MNKKHVFTHLGHNPKELVLGTGSAQRNNRLGRINSELQGNF
jgi:hypothetical protein